MALLAQESARLFDLTSGPMLRATVVRMGEREHVLLVTLHHIASDAWSMSVLIQDVLSLYNAHLSGLPSQLPELPLQYLDYSVWQRQRLQGELLQEQVTYWRRQMAGAPALLDLPTDRPRPPIQTYQGASLDFMLSKQTTARLRELGKIHGATLFMVLQAAFCVLMHRYSNQEDISLGTPTAGRSRTELEPLIGFFVNTLVLRTRIDPQARFLDLLAQVKETALQAYAHQDLPFEQLVNELKPTRSLSHSPLFQVMFIVQNAPRGTLNIPGLHFETLESPVQLSKYDLTCAIVENAHPHQLLGSLEYNTALFDESTMRRLVQHFEVLLEDVGERPEARVETLRLLCAQELHKVVVEWNDTATSQANVESIHQLFERQASLVPDAVAVVFEGQELTYAELDARASRLAAGLLALGVQAGTRVVLLAERGLEMMVGLLGILKAEAAYVPLDPGYPVERLAFMCEDSGAKVMLTQAHLVSVLPESAHCLTHILQEDWNVPPESRWSGLRHAGRPEDLAYVIYTSGSTGVPKGVMVEHRNVINLLGAIGRRIPLAAGEGWLAVTTISFDIAVLELFLPLVCGARIVLASREAAANPGMLTQLMEDHEVSIMQATPSTWKMLAEHGWPGRKVRVLSGGEPLLPGLAQGLLAYSGELWNLYGPTETTIWSTCQHLVGDVVAEVTLGRPLDNTQVYVLDPSGTPVPVGAVGEIHIGGAGVARGYIGRPELTAERFVRDPFSGGQGRLYKTGDMGRWLSDGRLQYLGRNDFQVKIRGARIELGEIDTCLISHPEVRDAVVVAGNDVSGNARLVAYVVPRGKHSEHLPGLLREYLIQRLPRHMVVSGFVFLDSMPLTFNGKIDRKALPSADQAGAASAAYEAPIETGEWVLASIWQELLTLERVGRNDHFFELGGHSLMAVSMVAKLRAQGLDLEVHSVFAAPRLADMAKALYEKREAQVPPNLIGHDDTLITPLMLPLATLVQADIDQVVARVRGGRANVQDIYALSPLQSGILFHHLMASQGDPYLLAHQLAFQDRGRLDRYLAGISSVIERHDILRTGFVWKDLSVPVQVVWREAPLHIEEVHLDPAQGAISEQLHARFDPRYRSIDVTEAGLLRAAIAYDSEHDRWLLLLLQHHLIGDHSTLEMLHEEVTQILAGNARTLGTARPFRNLIAQTFLEEDSERHEVFFREQLADIHEPALPYGIAQLKTQDIAEFRLALEPALLERLSLQARRLGVGLSSLCHLAWGLVVARTSGSDTVVFGTVLLGRLSTQEHSERTMGLFINTLPLRLELQDMAVDAAVRQAHANLTALLRHEHAPLALAQSCSGIAVPAPLFSALLNYRHGAMTATGNDSGVPDVEWLGSSAGATYPFCLTIEDYGQSLELIAHVASPISPARTCEHMRSALEQLADALGHGEPTRMDQLHILQDHERVQVLQAWNDTATQFDAKNLVTLFEDQVLRTPHATAVQHGSRHLSYEQLNQQANRLADALLAEGIGAQDLVALALPRSLEFVVAVWGVLKAGAAYLPLDLLHPRERIEWMLEDAKPVLALCLESALADFPASVPARALDAEQWLAGRRSSAPLNPVQSAEQLAYVVYTSGSTGQPKGVMVSHAAIANKIASLAGFLEIGADDRVSLLSGVSFDALIVQLAVPLICGGCTVVIDDATRDDLARFWEYVHTQGISVLSCVPSYLAHALSAAPQGLVVRQVLLGGEALSASVCQAIYHTLSAQRITNLYGPTETTCDATAYRVTQEDMDDGTLPIGRPLPNYQVFILDDYLEPVPVGVVGEVYLAGVGLARGYLHQPGLTAQRFIANPYGEAGSRMYRTGDLGSWRDDGTLVYRGRADQQMKLNGVRIEPGEIEAVLLQHEAVSQATVILRDEPRQLVGYAVLHEAEAVTPEALKNYLAERLPGYMVPAAMMLLDDLPRTVNGKLDTRALPAPQRLASGRRASTPQEVVLCQLFGEVLGLEEVGLDDSFFELGGHSLLAMRLINRIRGTLHVDVTIRSLFEAPTVAQLEAHLEPARLQRPLLEALPRPPIIPLSFAQQRLWFLAQLEGATSTYNVPFALRLRGPLDQQALVAALADLAQRHESLRTGFALHDGEPSQVVLTDLQPALRTVAVTEATLPQTLTAHANEPFVLDPSPPWRASLLVLGPQEHVLLVVLHHIVTDGASQWPLVRDLAQAYQARKAGHAPGWSRLPIQYADYSLWQRQWLGEEGDEHSALAHQLAYWRTALQDLPVQIALPTDRSRPALATARGGSVEFRLSATLHQRLLAVGRARQATLFMVLQAGFCALLSRLGAGTDIPIGSPTAGRVDDALEPLVGFFVNTLVLRTDTQGNPDFNTLVDRVRATDLEAYSNQDLPFERLVEALNPVRSLSHHALFQVAMSLEANLVGQSEQLAFTGLDIAPVTLSNSSVKFDLSLLFSEEHDSDGLPAGLSGVMEYRLDLFDPATVERLVARLVMLLEAAALAPDTALAALPLLEDHERVQVLQAWNDTATQFDAKNLVTLFEDQVLRTPHATAVQHGSRHLSYEQLNQQANRLADALLAEGIGAQDLVALALPRSLEFVVAVWGVLKAGAAYLPLDLLHPRERIEWMLEDAKPVLALCLESALADFPASVPARALDAEQWLAGRRSSAPLNPVQSAEQLAYVVYTSGSTGQPKGVMVSHAAIANKIASLAGFLEIGADDRVSLLSGVSFDALIVQLAVPLICGGCTVVIDDATRDDLARFWEYVHTQGISVLSCVPSYLAHALSAAPQGLVVRQVLLGGEALSASVCQAIYHTLSAQRITNLYGPTETTCDATAYRVTLEDMDDGTLPIGRPLPNYQVFILDDYLEPVPVGVVGEVYLAGVGLARGYLHQPGLTAQRFIANPYGEAGSRMYRTGDLGSWRDDGTLVYRGRADQQMKLNGVRIEPGEIEAVLLQHEAVSQATVILRDEPRQLVGYAVLHEAEAVTPEALKNYLAERLPGYMVPAAMMLLDDLPRTVNGKLDTRALPAPQRLASGRRASTPQEVVLCQLFGEVLGLEEVGLDDSFFELGGHSLLAMRLINRIRGTLHVDVTIRSLFEAPTVAQLEAHLEPARLQRPLLEALPRPPIIPLSFAQQRLWFLAQLEGATSTYNVPFALRLRGPLDQQALVAALADLAQRHESLRTGFALHDGEPSQVVLTDLQPALRTVAVTEATLPQTLAAHANEPFVLDSSPPWRASLLVLGPQEHVLLVVLHHIVTDGASQWPLVRDLAQAYQARKAGHAPGWSRLPIQYADYSLWQRQWLGDEGDEHSALAHQLAYWRTALQDLPVQIALPTDRSRPALATARGGSVEFRLSATLHQRLLAVGRARQATLFMVLQAGFCALLSRLGAGTDIPIGSPTAGRVDDALEPLVGFFVNTLVLRTDTQGNPDFNTLVDRVRATDLEAYSNQDLPFERLVEALNPVRSLSHHALFQVAMSLEANLVGQSEQLAFTGLDIAPVTLSNSSVKFDLSLLFSEEHDSDGLPAGLSGVMEYRLDLFDPATVERLVARLVMLLEAAALAPDTALAALPLLEDHERVQVLQAWNDTATQFDAKNLVTLFEDQVLRTPHATAVQHGSRHLSYEQLNQQANRLADALLAEGIGAQDLVALALPRSLEFVVAVWGVLKAGAAYLPLDLLHPRERIEWMLEDAKPVLALCLESALADFPASVPARALDAEQWLAGRRSSAPLNPVQSAEQLAYVVYTSGSTGQPKGVMVSHAAIANKIASLAGFLEIGADDRVSLLSGVSFDALIVQLAVPLICGGCTVVIDDATRDDLARFWEYVHTQGISVLSCVPSYLAHALSAAPQGLVVRQVLLGGEALSASVCQAIYHTLSAQRITNLYGPTETTCDATAYRVTLEDMDDGTLPIGRPLPNYQVFILDDYLEPVPVGVVGEVYLAGVGLARGYLHQPGLTAQRFIANPYGEAGSRMYRTGDLGSWRDDGTLVYRGRADQQMKLNGVRIEPGEIEAVLLQHEAVSQATVILRDEPRQLVGYAVLHEAEAVTPEALKNYLAERLPGYMVPAAMMLLDDLPRTVNGKLDTRALPAPQRLASGRRASTPQEVVLCQLFGEVLGLEEVGLDDSFFELGGHSLLAMRLINRIRGTLHVDVTIRSLFEAPTVAQLQSGLAQDQGSSFSVILPLRSVENAPTLYCIHPGRGLSWSYSAFIRRLPDISLMGIQARGIEGEEPFAESLAVMVEDYKTQILERQPQGPYHLLGWSFGGRVAFELACALERGGHEVGEVILLDPRVPFEWLKNENITEKVVFGAILSEAGIAPEDFATASRSLFACHTALRALHNPLGSIDIENFERIVEVSINNTHLGQEPMLSRYNGNVTYFTASQEVDPQAPQCEQWRPYIDGVLDNITVDSMHDDLLKEPSISLISGIINNAIGKKNKPL
ncbi:amino acid adenylation domain-containing protein [Pseudomonas sp. S3E17]|nr:amino acid adenylation domain-containing protein [Pseudomonas sp. S3E17]